MIDIGKLYCSSSSTGDPLRYGTSGSSDRHGNRAHARSASAADRRPIVVWNVTRTCNLKCVHCYTDSSNKSFSGELDTAEGKQLINDLSTFKIPSLLFSGGEPLMRKDLFSLVEHAASASIRPVISTNGTLITRKIAQTIKDTGVTYVGISLDGMEKTNDHFRGVKGTFKRAMKGFHNCRNVGQRVGLRLTLTKRNYRDLHHIFDFIEKEDIDRACFYHLVYSGRGKDMFNDDLTYAESRDAMDIILERTRDYYNRGLSKNILTVDNHTDGVYLYLKMKEENPEQAAIVSELLEWNGGGAFSTGVGIADIDFNGHVHPDQFWQDYSLGNIRERSFGDIWLDQSDPLMKGLKNKAQYIKGRCRLCRFKAMCNGSMRIRAYRAFNDPWAPDPQCYLSDREIGVTDQHLLELKEAGEMFIMPEALQ